MNQQVIIDYVIEREEHHAYFGHFNTCANAIQDAAVKFGCTVAYVKRLMKW